MHGGSGSALSNGCSWYTAISGGGHFFYGGARIDAPGRFDTGDEVSAAVDRRTHSGNGSNGMVGFLRNWKALIAEAETLPIEFAEEAVLVVSFYAKAPEL